MAYQYDGLGELKQQTDAKNQVTTFVYDLLGRLTQRTDNVGLPSQEIATFAFDT